MRALVQRLNELCNAVPFDASWYLKDLTTGQSADRRGRVPVPSASTRKISIKTRTGARGSMDAGIIFKDGRPFCILTAYTDHVPAALADGTPGFAAAAQLIGRMARLCYDELG